LTAVTFGLICKLGLHKSTPKRVQKLLGILGGVATALFVGFLVFHGGGGGWGFGPGLGFGGGGKSGSTEKSNPTSSRNKPEIAEAPKVQPSDSMRIRMLGGDNVRDERFYQLELGNEVYTLESLKPLIRTQMQGKPGVPGIKRIVIVIEKDSVAHDHYAVVNLDKYAHDQGLTVAVERPPSP
jgi:hypothetical protein